MIQWCVFSVWAPALVRSPVLLPTGHDQRQRPRPGLCRFSCRVTCHSCSFLLCPPGPGPTRRSSGDTTWSQESRRRRRYSGESKERSAWPFGRGELMRTSQRMLPLGHSWLRLVPLAGGTTKGCCFPLTDLKDLPIFPRWGRVSLSSPLLDPAQQKRER